MDQDFLCDRYGVYDWGMYNSWSSMNNRYSADDWSWVNNSGVYNWMRFNKKWSWVSDDWSRFNDHWSGMNNRCVHNCRCWVNGESYWGYYSGGGYGQES